MTEKPVGIVKFNKYYEKLNYPFFNTIRLATPIDEGDLVTIIHPMGEFPARVQFVHETPIKKIASSILMWDTGTASRVEAIQELREYYPHLTELTSVKLIGLKKEDSCPFKNKSWPFSNEGRVIK